MFYTHGRASTALVIVKRAGQPRLRNTLFITMKKACSLLFLAYPNSIGDDYNNNLG